MLDVALLQAAANLITTCYYSLLNARITLRVCVCVCVFGI
jgi:hypothetical protein